MGNSAQGSRLRHQKRGIGGKRSARKSSNVQEKAMAVEGSRQASAQAIGERSLAVSDMRSFYSLGRPVQEAKLEESLLSDCQQRGQPQTRKDIYTVDPSGSLDDRQRRGQVRVNFTKQFGVGDFPLFSIFLGEYPDFL